MVAQSKQRKHVSTDGEPEHKLVLALNSTGGAQFKPTKNQLHQLAAAIKIDLTKVSQ
jgi:hypothetical protein